MPPLIPMPAAQSSANIARHLVLMADARPNATAVKIPRGRTRGGDIDYLALTFRELDHEVAAWRARRARGGVRSGDRTLVMVRPGRPLIAAIFAMFRMGAIPVGIDPGKEVQEFLG